MDELKACPFCGSSNIQPAPLSDYEWYRCNDCDALSGRGGAIGWNSRPLEDALQAEIARLREAQRWIPVGERMPEFELGTASKYVEVAYRIPGSPNYLRGDVQYWEKYGWVFKWENGKAETFDDYGYIVEFWKPPFPLPQPPQEA